MRTNLCGLFISFLVFIYAGSAQSGVIYAFKCDDGTCAGDSSLSVLLEFDPSVVVGGATVSGEAPGFIGWTFAIGDPGSLGLSGTTFIGDAPSDLEFTFNSDASKISGINDDGGDFMELGTSDDDRIVFRETEGPDDPYFLTARYVSGFPKNGINIAGHFALVPLPAALPLFGTGLALIGFAGWRRSRTGA